MAQLKNTKIDGDLEVTGTTKLKKLATSATASAGTTPDATATWDEQGNKLDFSFVLPKGADGADGAAAAFTVSPKTGNTDEVYIYGSTATSGNPLNIFYSENIKFTGDGQIQASTFNARSDARLKENFREVQSERSILDLPIYKFDFIEGLKDQLGCKAQDLQEICPEIVNEGSDGFLSIQESKIVYLLLEEVKKLRKEVDELREG